jgi:hypothetical protein
MPLAILCVVPLSLLYTLFCRSLLSSGLPATEVSHHARWGGVEGDGGRDGGGDQGASMDFLLPVTSLVCAARERIL